MGREKRKKNKITKLNQPTKPNKTKQNKTKTNEQKKQPNNNNKIHPASLLLSIVYDDLMGVFK